MNTNIAKIIPYLFPPRVRSVVPRILPPAVGGFAMHLPPYTPYGIKPMPFYLPTNRVSRVECPPGYDTTKKNC